ncbi:hypothetical protein [Streptomyces sp. NPDC051546]|uniref:hypothetical protein n=1 Tax=Streptomyces sp. NPDC051546 TaxID=3365655 RepID=UPI0037A5048A
MPPATEWPKGVLQVVRGALFNLARCVTPRPGEGSAPDPEQPRHPHEDADPLGLILDALETFNTEVAEVHKRVRRLEVAGSAASARLARQVNDPLGPLFDALESINGELTGFAARLSRLEDTVFQAQFLPQPSRMANSSTAAATVRAALRLRARKAVSHA